jgi:hypothetical protein
VHRFVLVLVRLRCSLILACAGVSTDGILLRDDEDLPCTPSVWYDSISSSICWSMSEPHLLCVWARDGAVGGLGTAWLGVVLGGSGFTGRSGTVWLLMFLDAGPAAVDRWGPLSQNMFLEARPF